MSEKREKKAEQSRELKTENLDFLFVNKPPSGVVCE